LRFKDRDGGNCAAATATAAELRPGTTAGAVCGAGTGTEAVCPASPQAREARAASGNEEDDHHNDDGTGAGPVNRRLGV
jgi:hypothetical protein